MSYCKLVTECQESQSYDHRDAAVARTFRTSPKYHLFSAIVTSMVGEHVVIKQGSPIYRIKVCAHL